MTIDETIYHAEKVAKQQIQRIYNLSNITMFGNNDEDIKLIEDCEKCAEEHRQLAEWLKALKAVKDIIIQHDSDNMPEDFWHIKRIREEVNQ